MLFDKHKGPVQVYSQADGQGSGEECSEIGALAK